MYGIKLDRIYSGTRNQAYTGCKCRITRAGKTISRVVFPDGFTVAVWNSELTKCAS